MLFVFLDMPLVAEAVHITENFFNIDSRENEKLCHAAFEDQLLSNLFHFEI